MLRKVLAAGVLVLAAMCLTAPASYAEVGSMSFHPMEVSSRVMEVDSQGIALEAAANCSTSPAWAAFAAPDGSTGVERLPTCANDSHFGSGWMVADLPGGDDDEPIAAFCPAVAPRLMPSPDGDPPHIDDPGWCRA